MFTSFRVAGGVECKSILAEHTTTASSKEDSSTSREDVKNNIGNYNPNHDTSSTGGGRAGLVRERASVLVLQ